MQPFTRSEATSALVRYLAQHDKGTHLTYGELAGIASIPIHSNTSNLVYARRLLEREHAQVWVCVRPGVGVYRLTDEEIAKRQRDWFLFSARNKLTAAAREAAVVEIDRLDVQAQARFATDGIIREIARDALARTTQRRIEKLARGTSNDLPSFNAIEWMISLSPPSPPSRRQ